MVPVVAGAVRWEFDRNGDTEGWVALDGLANILSAAPLDSEVRDGVWRIWPSESAGDVPAIDLVSPVIRRDSGLFDRIQLRVRVIHSRPFEAPLQVQWRNSTNQQMGVPGVPPPVPTDAGVKELYYAKMVAQLYRTEWTTIEVTDLRTEELYRGARICCRTVWEGELLDMVVDLFLSDRYPARPEDIPEAVEIDWIWLTGPGEQLSGEGPPPEVEELSSFGDVFLGGEFQSLRSGVESPPWVAMASLSDVDADGDLDLISRWSVGAEEGWLVAVNDGSGRFLLGRERTTTSPLSLGVGDFDSDGLADLVIKEGTEDLWMLRNAPEEGFVQKQNLGDLWYVAVGDADGDGYSDLLTRSEAGGGPIVAWMNDGRGHLDALTTGVELADRGFGPWSGVHNLPGERTGVLWRPPMDALGMGYVLTQVSPEHEQTTTDLGLSVHPFLLRYVGDLDADGDVDVVVSQSDVGGYRGLDVFRNAGEGRLSRESWLNDVVLGNDVLFVDVNRDGVPDPVFVDLDPRGRAVVVALGQREGLPRVEGRYPISGAGGLVLGGDVDGDGDTDLVVLEKASVGGAGGLHLLRNKGALDPTAIQEVESSRPQSFALGQNHPNPFNSGTVIPFEVQGGPVDLAVYNTAGQLVRRVLVGQLDGGYHEVAWDGRDAAGNTMASGVLLYRLQGEGSVAVGKMMKLE